MIDTKTGERKIRTLRKNNKTLRRYYRTRYLMLDSGGAGKTKRQIPIRKNNLLVVMQIKKYVTVVLFY